MNSWTAPDVVMADAPGERWLQESCGRSIPLLLAAGYIVLFLLRPWESLWPALAAYRFERIYGVVMVLSAMLAGRGLRWDRQTIAVAGFGLCAVLSAYNAWQDEYAWPILYQYLTVLVTYFVFSAVVRRPRDLLLLVVAYVGTMGIYAAKSLWEYFVHDAHWYAQGVRRLIGIELTFGEPNSVAMSFVLALPVWWFLWHNRLVFIETSSRSGGALIRLLSWLFPPVALVVVGLTNSRAGMIGAAAFMVGLLWYGQTNRSLAKTLLAATLVLVLLWSFAPETQKQRLRTLWDADAGPKAAVASAEGRWQGFLAAWQMAEDRPVTGVGIGNFLPYRVALGDGVALVAHNLPGQILGEMGWLGLLAFAWLVWVLWRNTVRLEQDAHSAATEGDLSVSEAEIYRSLAQSIRLTLALGLLFGLSLHNGLRYNWIWMAALASLGLEFCQRQVEHGVQSSREGQTSREQWRDTPEQPVS